MREPLKLAIAGLGTVGIGVIKLLNDNAEVLARRCNRPLELVAVSARDPGRDRGVDLSEYRWVDDCIELARSPDIDIFVELIGGEDGPAKAAVEAALAAGHHVVTANKALLACHGTELARLAESHGAALNYEAAIAGGIPIVKTMRESFAGNRAQVICGILNGTCNYILTSMEREGREFADVLKDAQALGYAEADPTFDVGGFDAAHKLAILTSLAFGTEVNFEAIYVEGIDRITAQDIQIAGELGYRIKLLGVALETESGIEQRVHPTLVPVNSPIAQVDGVFNAVAVEGDFLGNLMLEGKGAGAGPTASSVVADIVDIARGVVLPPLGRPSAQLKPYERARMRAHQGGYYVALDVRDRPGAFAAIAQRMAEQNISLKSIVQRGAEIDVDIDGDTGSDRPETRLVVLITHDTLEKSIRDALAKIEADGDITQSPRMIRIEQL
ncbi:MAG: homoserine dehydrogenase [Hyphomicrobiales bacterium]